jgi:hypothetical protein
MRQAADRDLLPECVGDVLQSEQVGVIDLALRVARLAGDAEQRRVRIVGLVFAQPLAEIRIELRVGAVSQRLWHVCEHEVVAFLGPVGMRSHARIDLQPGAAGRCVFFGLLGEARQTRHIEVMQRGIADLDGVVRPLELRDELVELRVQRGAVADLQCRVDASRIFERDEIAAERADQFHRIDASFDLHLLAGLRISLSRARAEIGVEVRFDLRDLLCRRQRHRDGPFGPARGLDRCREIAWREIAQQARAGCSELHLQAAPIADRAPARGDALAAIEEITQGRAGLRRRHLRRRHAGHTFEAHPIEQALAGDVDFFFGGMHRVRARLRGLLDQQIQRRCRSRHAEQGIEPLRRRIEAHEAVTGQFALAVRGERRNERGSFEFGEPRIQCSDVGEFHRRGNQHVTCGIRDVAAVDDRQFHRAGEVIEQQGECGGGAGLLQERIFCDARTQVGDQFRVRLARERGIECASVRRGGEAPGRRNTQISDRVFGQPFAQPGRARDCGSGARGCRGIERGDGGFRVGRCAGITLARGEAQAAHDGGGEQRASDQGHGSSLVDRRRRRVRQTDANRIR